MRFRIQHYPQVPCKPFIFECASFEEADQLVCLLAAYDAFLYENKHRCDYASTASIQYYSDRAKDWVDYDPIERGGANG